MSLPTSPSSTDFRAALVSRYGVGSPPGAWRVAAAAAGVSGADAWLCRLFHLITAAQDCLAGSIEATRAQLRVAREAHCADDKSLFDELEAHVAAAEAGKRAALEREANAVDTALERLRAERGAAAEAAVSLGDAELEARHAELSSRLDAADAQLLALPTAVVEPPYVGVVIDEAALLAGAAVFGRVIDPQAITAADLTLEGTPAYTFPGDTLHLRLTLCSACHASQSAEELEVSLGAAAAATRVEATLEAEGVAAQFLHSNASADVSGRNVIVSIVVPAAAAVGSSVCFGSLTVCGKPVDVLPGSVILKPPGPADLSPEHAAQLQAWLPPGGSPSPGEWEEVYRATTHGFSAAAFHARCDGRARLLVLVRTREGGWLFGGFTVVGFIPGPERCQCYADPSAFLFSLTNSLGHPEKLDSKQEDLEVYYDPSFSATFGDAWDTADLLIWDNADTDGRSYTQTGGYFVASSSMGAHPMGFGRQEGWLAAEVVAWAV